MEDIFYFTKSPILLADIQNLAIEKGYQAVFRPSLEETLRVYIDETFTRTSRSDDLTSLVTTVVQDFWDWETWGAPDDYSCIERSQQEKVLEYQPVSAFMITYHESSLTTLARFLKAVLKKYGGWVACDDDWVKTYDAADIESTKCNE